MAQYIKKLASGGTADEPELQVRTLYGNYDAERLLANLDNPHNEEVFLNQFTRRKDREHAMAAYTAVKLAVADGSLHQDKDTRWYGNGISDDRFIGYAINFTKLIYNLMTPIKRNTTTTEKEEEKAKTKFNADSEFGKYFALTVFGGDKLTSQMKLEWQLLDDIDPNNKKVRSNTNHLAWLKEYLPKYRDYLNESTTDYDWGIHKNKESYIAKLDKAIQDLSTIGPEYGETEQKTLKSIFNDLGMAGNRKLFDVTNISGESGLPLRLLDIDPQEIDDIRFDEWLKRPENQQWAGERDARQVYETLRQLLLQSTRDLIDSLQHLQAWNEELNRIFNSPFRELVFYTLETPNFSNWGNDDQVKQKTELLKRKFGKYNAYNYDYLKYRTSLLADHDNAVNMSNFLYQMIIEFDKKPNDQFTKIGDSEYLINNTLNPSTGYITKFNSKTRLLSLVRINPKILKELLEKMKEHFYRQKGFKYILSNKQGGVLDNILYAEDGKYLLAKVDSILGVNNNTPRYEDILRKTRNTGVFPFNRLFNDTKDLRSEEELKVGALKIDLSYDDWVELGSALANLISAGLALKNKPTASLIAGAVGTAGNIAHTLHDKSLSSGEKGKYAASNALMWMASAVPIFGQKFANQQWRNASMKLAKFSAPFGAYLLATGSPEAAKAAKVIYDRSASGSWDQITKDEINLLLYGLTWLTNGVLFGKSEQIRRNTTTTTKGTNLNVHDEAGNRGKILNINDALRDGIQKATSLESLNLVLREWALANPTQVNGFDPATLLVDKQYIPSNWIPWKKKFYTSWSLHMEQSPFESYVKTTATPGRVQQQNIDDEAFKKAWTEGGRGELAAKAAANGTLSEALKADIQRYHKLNPKAPDVDLFLAMHQNTVLTDSNGKFSLLLNNGNKTTGWIVRNNDGGFEFVTSQNKPQNAIVDRVASKAEKDAIKRLLDKLILKYRTFGYDADNIAELQWDFDSYFNNIKITRQSKPKTTKSATKPATTETPAAGTPAEPVEGATTTERQGGKLERLLALKKNGGIVKALPGTALTITPAPGSWYTRRYPQQILEGFPDQYGRYSYYKNNLLNTHNRGATNEETNNIWNLASPEAFNTAYTNNLNLVGQDLNTYYNNAYNGKSLEDYVTGYNKDAASIRGFWHYGLQNNPTNYIANTPEVALQHNQLFRQMFANRSRTETNDTNRAYNIGYQDDDIESWMGTSTWKRRMDLYEKEFDVLTPEEKKKRVHKIGDLGWVYKKANGDIAILSPDEIKDLGLENPAQPQTPQPEQAPAPATEGEKPGQQGTPQEGAKQQPQKTGVGSGATSGIPGRSGKWKEWIKNFPDFRPEILDIARLMANLRGNSKMYDLAKQLRTPLKNPMVAHRNVYTGFDIELAANQQANQLLANAGLARTSDASINEALALEAQYKGLNITREGQLKSDQILRDTAEKQWAVDREVDKYNLGVADFNNAALHELYNQEIKAHMGKIRSNMDSINNYLMANESRLRLKRDDLRDKRERYQDKAEEAWLAHLIANDETVRSARQNWLDVSHRTGVTPAELYLAQYQYQDAQLAATWKYTLEYLKNKGVDISHYENNQPRVVKKGGTLDDTQVKKRSKDNDRLIKQIIAGLRENSKALDRLSKALLLSIRSILK